MLQLAADLRLLDEPLLGRGLPGEFGLEHLDGQVAAEVGVAALEDDPHAAAGDLAEELVAARPPPRGISGDDGLDERARGRTGRRAGAAAATTRRASGRGPNAAASPASRAGSKDVRIDVIWRVFAVGSELGEHRRPTVVELLHRFTSGRIFAEEKRETER